MFLFLSQIILISLSGVMSPGPLTAVIVGQGGRSPHAGAFISIGHGVVEFPLMAGIFFGLGAFITLDPVKMAVFSLGGLFLVWMGIGMLRSSGTGTGNVSGNDSRPVVAGIVLTVTNPYFYVWWATVGAMLIARALGFGVFGFILFAIVHWLCDFLWNYFLSAASYKGGRVFGDTFQRVVFLVCGTFLIVFGGMFLLNAIRLRIG